MDEKISTITSEKNSLMEELKENHILIEDLRNRVDLLYNEISSMG